MRIAERALEIVNEARQVMQPEDIWRTVASQIMQAFPNYKVVGTCPKFSPYEDAIYHWKFEDKKESDRFFKIDINSGYAGDNEITYGVDKVFGDSKPLKAQASVLKGNAKTLITKIKPLISKIDNTPCKVAVPVPKELNTPWLQWMWDDTQYDDDFKYLGASGKTYRFKLDNAKIEIIAKGPKDFDMKLNGKDFDVPEELKYKIINQDRFLSGFTYYLWQVI